MMSPVKRIAEAERHFVFLQGMPSAFFTRLGRELSSRGFRATGINLCGGDWVFWRGPGKVNYRGDLAGWPAFIGDYFDKNHVTDLVVLGDQRRYHKQAIEQARQRGIRITVFDFGYLRPGRLTMEEGGKNANSPFPKDPDGVLRLADTAPEPRMDTKYPDRFATMAVGDLIYNFANLFLFWLFPRYRRSDDRPHPLAYYPAMGLRLLMAKTHRRQGDRRMQQILRSKARYFVLPLQLHFDYQILAYSPFASLEDAVRLVIRSFASRAPEDALLLVKVHPWDPCLKNWKQRISQWSREAGVGSRVEYFDGGDLDAMTLHAEGMITVNSTSGIAALQMGRPLMALGNAIYNMPGLTFQGGIDDFWHKLQPPDAQLVKALIKAIASTIQIRGGFFSEPGMGVAVQEAAERLCAEPALKAMTPAVHPPEYSDRKRAS